MIRKCFTSWSHLAGRNGFVEFVDIILRGYSQIFFCNNPLIGLVFLVVSFYYPLGGVFGIIGSACANMTAMFLHVDRPLIRTGIFGVSGSLIGFAWAIYLTPSIFLVALLVPAAAFSSLLLLALLATISRKLNLPALSFPFVIIGWMIIMAMRQLDDLHPIWLGLLKPVDAVAQAEESVRNFMPDFGNTFFQTMSSILFQESTLVGIIVFLAILSYSRISALFAIIGGVIGATFVEMSAGTGDSGDIIIQFNCVLTAIALGGFFVVFNLRSSLYALLAVVICGVIGMAADSFYDKTDLPLLALPFNMVTLLFLYLLWSGFIDTKKSGLHPVPLHLAGNPEKSLAWHKQTGGATGMQRTILSLPFYGAWYVSQGNHGPVTHWARMKYALDFIALDDRRKSHKDRGRRNDEYYAFGKPVLAPAAGTVVKVVNNIPDNIPAKVNEIERWGNYVVIDHWNGEFSNLSHFKRGSIIVNQGDNVAQGQIIGCCGNSGFSYEAHIHYQLQNSADDSAETLPIKLSYVKQTDKGQILVETGIPREGEMIGNKE
ncbi:MAG: urea transporter [Dehalococcoidia bacterium]